MSKYKYFVQTYNQLPQSKQVWDNIWRLPFLIKKMIEKKPENIPYPDLENSICVVRIDTTLVPMWQIIYSEMLLWNWDTVKPLRHRRKYIHADGRAKTMEEIQAWIRQKQEELRASQ